MKELRLKVGAYLVKLGFYIMGAESVTMKREDNSQQGLAKEAIKSLN